MSQHAHTELRKNENREAGEESPPHTTQCMPRKATKKRPQRTPSKPPSDPSDLAIGEEPSQPSIPPSRRRKLRKIKHLPTSDAVLVLNAVLLKLRLVVGSPSRPAENLHSDRRRLADQHVAESGVRVAIGVAGPGDGVPAEADAGVVLGVGFDGGSVVVVESAVCARTLCLVREEVRGEGRGRHFGLGPVGRLVEVALEFDRSEDRLLEVFGDLRRGRVEGFDVGFEEDHFGELCDVEDL
jgi:hypothetical protein